MHLYQPTYNLLKDRIVLITGASRGIGRAVAKAYATHGATVILAARDVTALSTRLCKARYLSN
jgi:NAD(P)-dependent dehydrogenase (short-subunit alcohol dehydrogenase family)